MNQLLFENAALFIDGGYQRKLESRIFKNTNIDYLKLSNKICSDLNLKRLRTYFYHCMPIVRKDNEKDLERRSNFQKFLSNIKKLPRFEVRLGRLQLIGNQFHQKMVDVLMSLDIINLSFENQIKHAILITGDADFVPVIKKIKDHGTITHLYYHPSSINNELLEEVDELHKINKELINDCLLD